MDSGSRNRTTILTIRKTHETHFQRIDTVSKFTQLIIHEFHIFEFLYRRSHNLRPKVEVSENFGTKTFPFTNKKFSHQNLVSKMKFNFRKFEQKLIQMDEKFNFNEIDISKRLNKNNFKFMRWRKRFAGYRVQWSFILCCFIIELKRSFQIILGKKRIWRRRKNSRKFRITMQILEPIYESLMITGLSANQSIRKHPFNARNLTSLFLFGLNLVSDIGFVIYGAVTDPLELFDSLFITFTIICATSISIDLIWKMRQLFEFLGSLGDTVTQSKLAVDFSQFF